MHDRFQVAIDRAAAVAGLTTTDDYVNEWRRVATSVEGDAIAAAHATAQRLDNDHPETCSRPSWPTAARSRVRRVRSRPRTRKPVMTDTIISSATKEVAIGSVVPSS